MSDCLSESDLHRYHAHEVEGAEAERVRRHLAECQACARRDAALVSRHEARINQLHGMTTRETDVPSPGQPSETVAASSPPAPGGDHGARAAPSTGPAIEGYEITRELHRGGQGVVYQAIQTSTKRKVAIKVLLEGPYASDHARRRFEREIELVASLRHPNIIAIFHSGQTPEGQQYCVMDYVRGVPLDRYAREKKLTLEEALTLFSIVCDAVNYAHQRGVIHRDLKPSNILVDTNGEPKVLDFGLAKMVGGPEQTLLSVTGQVVGTLPYMSPEQARGDPDEIDIRTDVYALGVILYEMLTGQYPYPVAGQMAEVLQHIAETPPAPLSRSWKSDSGITRRSSRRLRPGECPIDDEVQTIVWKALSKERQRRYQSPGELARDVGHYLAGEPIEAKRDSALYVLRKQLRRYKVPVAASLAFVVLLAGASIVSTRLYLREQLAREQAEEAQSDEVEAKIQAQAQRDRAIDAEKVARQQAYVANIFAAGAALSMNEVASVRRRLDAAPEEFRNWEWQYLHAQAENSLAVLRGHEETVWRVAFSPDGTRLVSGSNDKTVRLWDASTGEELAVLRGHGGPISSVAFSPDGTRLASVSAAWFDKIAGDNTVRVWDAFTGKELAVLRGHEGRVFSVAYSPDGTRLASGSEDTTVRLWDVYTGEELAVLRGHEGLDVYAFWGIYLGPGVAFSPAGTRLASWSGGTLRFWDVSTGKQLRVLLLQGHMGLSVAFSPDWTRVAWESGGSLDKPSDYTVHVTDVITGEESAVLRGHEKAARSLAFSPDGTRLASASKDKTIRLWDAFTGEELAVLRGHEHIVWSAVFSPDGTRLASGSEDKTVRLWDASTGEELAVLRGHEDVVRYAAFSPDGTHLASASEDGTVRLWDVYAGEKLSVLRHEERVASVAFSPDGTRLALGSDETVRLWDASTGEELAVLRGHTGFVTSVAFSPDGTRLASGSGSFDFDNTDNTVRVWNASTGEQLRVLQGHEAWVISVTFSPDGTRLASCSGSFDNTNTDNTVRVWNASTGEQLRVLQGHEASVISVAFSPDGARLASGSADSTVRLWDVSTGQELAVLRGPEAGVGHVAFSPDGTRLALGSDETVRLWDASTGEELGVLRGHGGDVESAVFSPDGTRLASGSEDTTVRLWDVYTGEELAVLRGHEERVGSVAFSPDGTRLASSSWDETVRLWDTVPYRIRYQERQAILAARPEAQRLVDDLWQKLNDWDAIAQRLREDASLSESVRRAALNLVLQLSFQEHSRKVGELTQELGKAATGGDVKKALEIALQALGHAKAMEAQRGKRAGLALGLTNYNVACMYSLLGKKDQALEHLERTVEVGDFPGNLVTQMEGDSDLDSIRDDPRYAKVLAKARAKAVGIKPADGEPVDPK